MGGGIPLIINKLKYFRLSRKLGFSIGYNSCDYGLVIPHHGTIVVGNTNRIGPYAVCILLLVLQILGEV